MVNIFIFQEKNVIERLGEKIPKVKGKFQLETQGFTRNAKRVYL